MIVYLDTSAALKLAILEDESPGLHRYLRTALAPDDSLTASWLLHAEMHCGAQRRPTSIRLADVEAVLQRVTLFDVVRADLLSASSQGHRLRTNDAIHLAAAVRIGAETLITYDAELQVAATAEGIAVAAPS